MELVIISLSLAISVIGIFLFRLSLRQRSLQIKNKRLATLRKLDEIMMSVSISVSEVAQRVVDTIAFELGFSFGVIAIVEPERGTLKRVAVSRTEAGLKGVSMFPVNFHELRIPLTATQNLGVKALKENKLQITNSLYDMLVPAVSKDFSDKLQVFTGIKTTYVFPIISQGKQLGIMIVSFNKDTTKIKRDEIEIVQELLGVVINNALLYQSLHETTRKLAQANIKLEQLDKLKDDFVSVASHELRTPMTAIRSYSWMALNKPDIKLSEKMKKYLSRVLISTERLINLVNDMLNVSRIEAGRIEIRQQIFDIGVLVDDVMAEVTPKANEKMVQLEVGKVQLPKIFADPDKVHQVLLNLIGNSLKFTPTDGLIKVNFFSDGKVIEIKVSDNGVGISKEDLSRLFQKFGRLDNSYVAAATSGGTGLGLYISKSLVELMHGTIKASSEGVEIGATFTFSLPIATPEIVAQSEKYTKRPVGEAKVLEPVAI